MPRVAYTLSDIHVRRLKHTGPTTSASGKPRFAVTGASRDQQTLNLLEHLASPVTASIHPN